MSDKTHKHLVVLGWANIILSATVIYLLVSLMSQCGTGMCPIGGMKDGKMCPLVKPAAATAPAQQ
jgi:hypothetical protein